MFDRSGCEAKAIVTVSLRMMVRDLDPTVLSSPELVGLVDWFADIERLGAAGKAIAARGVADSSAWQAAGARSAADWLATRTGSTVGEARASLDTAGHLNDAPATDDAFRAGALSVKQAEAVAAAASVAPDEEGRLLDLARNGSLQKLRDESARILAAAEPDPAARHERIRKGRFWRRWTRPDGSRAGMYAGTPEEVALIEAATQPFIDARIDEARRNDDHEPSEAYAFDGLVGMANAALDARDADPAAGTADGGGDEIAAGAPAAAQPDVRRARGGRGRKRMSERRELIGIVDLEALHRGYLLPGELCEIPGVGPISIEAARRVFGDALLRIVIRDGVDIRTVVHAGRTANAVQETGVFVRQLGRCARPGCSLPISEIDHHDDFVRAGAASLDGLVGLCGHDHDLKTRHGHTYRLDPDNHVTWARPDGTVEHERPPP